MKNQTPNETLPYGTVDCPCCDKKFDVRKAKAAFIERAGPQEGLVYAMCPTCHETFEAVDSNGRKSMENRCFLNVKNAYRNGVSEKAWAVTTVVTLLCHGENLTSAMREGIDLPRPIYDAIRDGRFRLEGICPFGITGHWVDETEARDDDA